MGGRRSRKGGGEDPTRQRGTDRGARAPGTQDIEGKFFMGKEAVPKVIREVGVGGGEGSDEVVFRRPH